MELLHVGFGGSIAASRVLAVCAPDSSPIKRLIRQAKDEGKIIDLTYGRKMKTVIVLDTGHLALVALQPETISSRIKETGRISGKG
ncbi:MAG: DUF370 domain-containing protein [Chloroflexi bacterium]|nr:DUF370 domain-containing protein [Chloroflexota bacterium]